MAEVCEGRVLTQPEQELAARCALLAAEMYDRHGWEYGSTWADEGYVPDVEKLAQTISHLLRSGGGATGRFMVAHTDLGTEVYLELGMMSDEGDVYVDDRMAVVGQRQVRTGSSHAD